MKGSLEVTLNQLADYVRADSYRVSSCSDSKDIKGCSMKSVMRWFVCIELC